MSDVPRVGHDRWSAWLAAGRFVGMDQATRQSAEDMLAAVRNRVIDGACLHPGEHAVDLGAGTGMLAAAAARAVAPGGTVTAIDISRPALARIDTASSPVPIHRLTADATRLPLADATADAVLTRSVLIYIHDLPRAIAEIARILRPGGRLSASEPTPARRRHDARLTGLTDEELAAIDRARRQATPESAAMFAFSEHGIAELAKHTGLTIDMLRTDAVTEQLATTTAMDNYLNRSLHPGAPSQLEQVTAALGPETAHRYQAAWHHAVTGHGPVTFTVPVMYLSCHKN
jgi:ubiquinone/menaquinone biosynthesis C-methylase UbiE